MRIYVTVDKEVEYPIIINIEDVYFIEMKEFKSVAIINKYTDLKIGKISIEAYGQVVEALKHYN